MTPVGFSHLKTREWLKGSKIVWPQRKIDNTGNKTLAWHWQKLWHLFKIFGRKKMAHTLEESSISSQMCQNPSRNTLEPNKLLEIWRIGEVLWSKTGRQSHFHRSFLGCSNESEGQKAIDSKPYQLSDSIGTTIVSLSPAPCKHSDIGIIWYHEMVVFLTRYALVWFPGCTPQLAKSSLVDQDFSWDQSGSKWQPS